MSSGRQSNGRADGARDDVRDDEALTEWVNMAYSGRTSEQQPTRVTGRLFPMCFGLALIALFFKVLCRCRFFLSGDATAFVKNVGLLSQGYLQTNLEALHACSTGGTGQHVQCATEAGFVCILWLASHLGWEAVFYVNAFFLTAAIAALCLLFREIMRDTGCAELAAGLVLLLLVVAPVFDVVLSLALPFRDTSALCFSLWGLYVLMVAVARVGRAKTWRLALSGLLLGLAAWMRLTHVLLVIPAGLYLAWHTWRQTRWMGGRKRVGLAVGVLLWGAMVLVGPGCVAVQGVLETGHLAVPGWANASLVQQSVQATADHEEPAPRLLRSGSYKGVHWCNANKRLPGVVRQIVDSQFIHNSWGVGFLLITGALLCRRALLGLVLAAPLVFLYGCYDKVVLRYNIPAILLVGAVLACAVAALSVRSLRLMRKVRPRVASTVGGAAVFLFAAVLVLPSPAEVRQFSAQREAARTSAAWIQDTTQTYQAVVTSWTALAALWAVVSPETLVVQKWVSGHLWDQEHCKRGRPSKRYLIRERMAHDKRGHIVSLLGGGGKALLVLRRTSAGREAASWVKDDLMHSFNIVFRPELSLGIEAHKTGLIAYEIESATLGPRRIAIPLGASEPALVLAHLRSLSGTNHQQATVSVASHRIAVELEGGMNLIPVPTAATNDAIELTSPMPLPSIVRTDPMGVEPVVIDLGEYGQAPSNIRMAEGFRVTWSGYEKWFRDWGGDGREPHMSRPHFRLQPEGNNCLNIAPPIHPYVLRLVYRIRLRERPSVWKTEALRYTFGKQRVDPTGAITWPDDSDDILMHELDIAAQDSTLPSFLNITMNTGTVALAELTSIEYMLRPSRNASPPSSVPPLVSVMGPVLEDGLAGRTDSKHLRLLGEKPTGFCRPQSGSGAVVVLAFVNPTPSRTSSRAFCEWGSQVGFVDLPAQPGMVLVALPCPARAHGDIGIWLPGKVDGEGAYVVRWDTVELSDLTVPPDVCADGGVWFTYFTRGLYAQHRGPGQKMFCWTSGLVTLDLPLFDASRDVEAVLEVVGPPVPVGPLAVTLVINGRTFPAQDVSPGAQAVLKWKVSADMLTEVRNRVELKVATWQPSAALGTADERKLGVMFRRLTWR